MRDSVLEVEPPFTESVKEALKLFSRGEVANVDSEYLAPSQAIVTLPILPVPDIPDIVATPPSPLQGVTAPVQGVPVLGASSTPTSSSSSTSPARRVEPIHSLASLATVGSSLEGVQWPPSPAAPLLPVQESVGAGSVKGATSSRRQDLGSRPVDTNLGGELVTVKRSLRGLGQGGLSRCLRRTIRRRGEYGQLLGSGDGGRDGNDDRVTESFERSAASMHGVKRPRRGEPGFSGFWKCPTDWVAAYAAMARFRRRKLLGRH